MTSSNPESKSNKAVSKPMIKLDLSTGRYGIAFGKFPHSSYVLPTDGRVVQMKQECAGCKSFVDVEVLTASKQSTLSFAPVTTTKHGILGVCIFGHGWKVLSVVDKPKHCTDIK